MRREEYGKVPGWAGSRVRQGRSDALARTLLPGWSFKGVMMPRKSKGLKSKLRDAATAAKQGKKEEANKIWQQVAADRIKLKAEKAAKRAEKKAKAK